MAREINVLVEAKCLCLSFEVLTEEYNRILIFKEPASGKVLNGHVMRTEKVTDEGSCRVECYLEPNCVSVNVGPYDEGNHMCELNNATDESPTLSNLSNRKSYTYHGVEVHVFNCSNNSFKNYIWIWLALRHHC